MAFVTLTKEDFKKHTEQAKEKSFMQSVEMAELLSQRGYAVKLVGWTDDKQDLKVSALIYCQQMTGGRFMALDAGPVVTDPAYLSDFYRALQTFAKAEGALVLQIKPYASYQTFTDEGEALDEPRPELIDTLTQLGYQHGGLYTGYLQGESSWQYLKDLENLTEADLVKSFSKKGKPLLKKAKSFGTQVRPLKREELHLFKDITESTADRHQFSDKDLAYYQDFYDTFGDRAEFMAASLNLNTYLTNLQADQDKLKAKIDQLAADIEANPKSEKKKNQHRELSSQYDTFTVRIREAHEMLAEYGQEDLLLAASLFVYMPNEAYYFMSGSYSHFSRFYAPILLQEYVMEEAIRRGIPRYNLLGVAGDFDGSDGVLRFKQNFKGYTVQKTGTFTYYPSPLKYRLISGIKKLLGR